jgi:regulator of sirC expression with transglutaminase-like and TPR domain
MSVNLAIAQNVADLVGQGNLAGAAFAFSTFTYPDLDIETYDDRLTAMAERVEGPGHLALRRVVAISEGLGGDVDDYDDPRNSYLHEVLNRRKGIPISLSAIWIEVGRRAGMEVLGVGLPGHFLVYADGQLCDPFHGGEAIGSDEAASLVSFALGGPPRLDRSWLEPVPDIAIVERMLRNLSQSYSQRGNPEHSDWIAACLAALGAEIPD